MIHYNLVECLDSHFRPFHLTLPRSLRTYPVLGQGYSRFLISSPTLYMAHYTDPELFVREVVTFVKGGQSMMTVPTIWRFEEGCCDCSSLLHV
jgi:hypothetical protein